MKEDEKKDGKKLLAFIIIMLALLLLAFWYACGSTTTPPIAGPFGHIDAVDVDLQIDGGGIYLITVTATNTGDVTSDMWVRAWVEEEAMDLVSWADVGPGETYYYEFVGVVSWQSQTWHFECGCNPDEETYDTQMDYVVGPYAPGNI
jgi:hypothetical protein